MTKVKRFASLFLVIAMLFTAFATLTACKEKLDNEETRLVLASAELDGVFNPFFSSSGADSNIVGMTQLSMLSADKNGKEPAVGEGEACAVLDYDQRVWQDGSNKYTTYSFVLKKGLKFSNGSPLTMRDVLFNLYVYLDPSYTGSATIYSTDIVGLAAYRTQIADAGSEQDEFNRTYEQYGWDRLYRLYYELVNNIYKDKAIDTNKNGLYEDEEIVAALNEIVAEFQGYIDEAKAKGEPVDPEWTQWVTLGTDYKRAKELFKQELDTDYTLSIGTAEEIKYTDKSGKEVHLTTDTEAFLFNENFITWNEDDKVFEYNGFKGVNWSREKAIQTVYDSYVKSQSLSSNNMSLVLVGSGTTANLVTEFTAMEKKAYFDSLTDAERTKSIKGIQFANYDKAVTVNGKTYNKVEYAKDGSVANDTNEVLEITINKVDPKAIWNFGFSIAPMYYYSSPAEIAKFDFIEHFGVDFGNINFMNDYVKATNKIGLPVGAGPYKATTSTGDSSKVTSATFNQNNVVYFERNEHFLLGPAKIKYINYQVVDTKLMLDSLFSGNIHFAEPACKQENIDMITAEGEGYAYNYVPTNGYGYIGINAEKVPCLEVRQIIMSAIDTSLCVGYYGMYASSIYRPMTRESWAYPKETDEDGPYYKPETPKDLEDGIIEKKLEALGYAKNSKGVYAKGSDTLKYTFTIAGDSEDHPAWNAMDKAAKLLNAHGFDINVKKDIHALKKLNTGDLAVWAAAWGSGIDPDMYQVYHIDSLAGSTANWGYRAIRNDKGKGDLYREYEMVEKLSKIIDEARETLDQDERKELYAKALDIVMDLAVELPTYQRSDLFAYNSKIIDASTLTQKADLTSFNGPLARIWEVSFVNQ